MQHRQRGKRQLHTNEREIRSMSFKTRSSFSEYLKRYTVEGAMWKDLTNKNGRNASGVKAEN